jgi:3-oxoacyl-[acyl-carrier protein] reductase
VTTGVGVFDGRVVLVTGGSRGIGRAIAKGFAVEGARVAVHFVSNEAAADATVAALGPGGHAAVQADFADPDGAGRLVNNAGIYEPHPVVSTPFEEWQRTWRRTIQTNLLAAADLIHRVVPSMMERGGGRIVNVTSRGAFRGEPDHAAYGASKAALNSLSQSLAQALAPHAIYVTAVAPGFVETDMAAPYLDGPGGDAIRAQSPMGRAATADEVARVVVFLASPGAESTTGGIVDVNGASYLRT